MKILVPIKRVLDAAIKPRIKQDGRGVELSNLKMSANPFDEIALEEAIRIKESAQANEIVVVSIGPSGCQETLRAALALGADRAILLETNDQLFPLTVAKLLKEIVNKEKPDLVIMGKQAIDDDSNQTGQMLAGLLEWPQGTFVSKLTVNETKLIVEREIDGGNQVISIDLPCLITTDLRLNTPRYAKLIDIMKAKQKPMEIIAADSLGINLQSKLSIEKVETSLLRRQGIRLQSVDELVKKLKDLLN